MKDVARLEYVWLDGYGEETFGGKGIKMDGYVMPRLRSKWRYVPKFDKSIEPIMWTGEDGLGSSEVKGHRVPLWTMDASSTAQASPHGADPTSDRPLKPVMIRRNPLVTSDAFDSYLVLSEVLERDKVTPHPTNRRAALATLCNLIKDEESWSSFEQEYTLFNAYNNLPFGWSNNPADWPIEGLHYCSANAEAERFGANIVRAHEIACLQAGIIVYGGNNEVMPSQHEFQIYHKPSLDAVDELQLARHILNVVAARNRARVSYNPKPTAWMVETMTAEQKNRLNEAKGIKDIEEFVMNGAGCHRGWSDKVLRELQKGYKEEIVGRLQEPNNHNYVMESSGEGNRLRMTGKCETASYDLPTYGEANRNAALRAPDLVGGATYHIEDRRLAADHEGYESEKRFLQVIYFPDEVPKEKLTPSRELVTADSK